ncbi:hypothetical protein EV659_108144 [Rhodothalassium salexigens DSM 2132]|uniref:Uncharacterized protein n=1 Tax=Rhodothalassium salexigens DSM 2132 TaxID=1188247 RepID=A0A4R2PEW9_RHOSA|nr:hypothetical protein [Rhodothalassium salexigens]MBB4212170.1 hypothetical protein [Rhodothalassium salexigens DSM 2132]MBK1638163.1 hypothetical protein [Rhodothalassium salexigens DSM 2132]TCP33044.1 hypothetical protein EV659_108144 [Rhodothalassium salexigens DSM 2132]
MNTASYPHGDETPTSTPGDETGPGAGPETETAPRGETDAEPSPALPARLPRILLLDPTRIGNATATGELKATLFAPWGPNRLFQIFVAEPGFIGVRHGRLWQRVATDDDRLPLGVLHRLLAFAPELIVVRPVPDQPVFHAIAMDLVHSLGLPVVTWIMDDWPERLRVDDPAQYARLAPELHRLLARSVRRLSIGDAMTEAFEARYGLPFEAFANGVDRAHWPAPPAPEDKKGPVLVRYGGALAANMNRDSVLRVADAVERLAGEGLDVRFEIKTGRYWYRQVASTLAPLDHSRVIRRTLSRRGYRRWLQGADIALIAYNFDDASQRYTRYSVANKLPECLASGAALLFHGPMDTATGQIVAQSRAGAWCAAPDPVALTGLLRDLVINHWHRRTLGERGRALAFADYDIHRIRARFAAMTVDAASRPMAATAAAPLTAGAWVNEPAALHRLLSQAPDRRAPSAPQTALDRLAGLVRRTPFARQPTLARLDRPLGPDRTAATLPQGRWQHRPASSQAPLDLLRITGEAAGETAGDRPPPGTGTADQAGPLVAALDAALARRPRPRALALHLHGTGDDQADQWAAAMARLADADYALYASLWHAPRSTRYHAYWQGLVALGTEPDAPRPEAAWGTLLAFRDDPGGPALRDALLATLTVQGRGRSLGRRLPPALRLRGRGIRGRWRQLLTRLGGG